MHLFEYCILLHYKNFVLPLAACRNIVAQNSKMVLYLYITTYLEYLRFCLVALYCQLVCQLCPLILYMYSSFGWFHEKKW